MVAVNVLGISVVKGKQYLTRTAQYASVYDKGDTWVNNLVVMKALPNELDLSRYGLSVSKRVGKAVVRNRVKRRLREILRKRALRPGRDVIFIARVAAARTDYSALEKSVNGLLTKAGLL